MNSWDKIYDCKRRAPIKYLVSIALFLLYIYPIESIRAQFAKGADVGWLSYFEDTKGISYINDQGEVQDALAILKDHEMNAIRLRAFVNPTLETIGKVDTQSVVQTAVRANNLGMDVMITIHYSDVWADPGSQHKPVAWENLSFDDLAQAVYDYTYNLVDALVSARVTPKWVQVGNETNPGFLWEEGRLSTHDNFNNMNRYVALSNKGYEAIKARSPNTQVITHLAGAHNTSFFQQFFDAFYAFGGKNDVIGVSYYPRWNGSDLQPVATNLNNLISRYDKDVMICEIGNWEDEPVITYNLLVDVMDMVQALPQGKGRGVFYWEPIAHTSINGYQQGLAVPVHHQKYQFSWALDGFLDSAQPCSETTITPNVKIDDQQWSSTTILNGFVGGKVQIRPQGPIGGTWQWRGPNGFSSNRNQIDLTNLQKTDAGNYLVTYIPSDGCPAQLIFSLNVFDAGQVPIENAGFEDGVVTPWVGVGNFGVDTDLKKSGTFSGWFGGGISELSQTIVGLSPNTTYEYSCYIRNWSGDDGMVTVGVRDYGGNQRSTQIGITGNNGNDFELAKVVFTTGSTNTTATIYAGTIKNQTWGKIDDAKLYDSSTLGVDERLAGHIEFKLFPNPTSGRVNIDVKDFNKNIQISIYSIQGKKILSKQVRTTGPTKFSFSIANLACGTYVVQLQTDNGRKWYTKLIKE